MENAIMPTRIEGSWVVGFDGTEHVLLRDGAVLIEDDTIVWMGHRDDRPSDGPVIGGRGRLVIPGFINAHVHASSQASERMIADSGRPDLYNTGFLNYMPHKGRPGESSGILVDPERPDVGGVYTVVNLLRSGCTTMVEMGGELGGVGQIDGFVDVCDRLGMRAYLSPGYSAGTWYYDNDNRLKLSWDEAAGIAGLQRAIKFTEDHHGSSNGRIRGMLFPLEVATSTPRLLAETIQAADRLNVGISIHAGEAQLEWHRIVTEYGLTPVRFLARCGLLRPGVILGHCVFIDQHSATTFVDRRDLQLLAESGVAVAHCPLVFARRGFALESFDRYRLAGVTMALGTDVFPQDMLFEMKVASLVAKVVDRSFSAGHARDLFNAATLGGARALGRTDLGRLAPGALADVAVVNLRARHIGSVRDPISALIHSAGWSDVEHVLVNGRVVVSPNGVVGVDETELTDLVQTTGETVWRQFDNYRWDGMTLDEIAPHSFRTVRSLPG